MIPEYFTLREGGHRPPGASMEPPRRTPIGPPGRPWKTFGLGHCLWRPHSLSENDAISALEATEGSLVFQKQPMKRILIILYQHVNRRLHDATTYACRNTRCDKPGFHPVWIEAEFGHKKPPDFADVEVKATNYGLYRRQSLGHDTLCAPLLILVEKEIRTLEWDRGDSAGRCRERDRGRRSRTSSNLDGRFDFKNGGLPTFGQGRRGSGALSGARPAAGAVRRSSNLDG
jgi:hypothetical protein